MKARKSLWVAVPILVLVAVGAMAQDYPTKPIRLVLPFAGGTDVVGRLLGLKLSPVLGQQVVADPRLGAGGNIAHVAVAKAAPDGHTLLMAGPPVVMNPHVNPKSGFDPLKDYAAVALIASIPNILVVHPSVPANSLQELIQYARSNPNKLKYGSGGVGSSNHTAAEMMKSLTQTQIVHVPYKSATIALTGLLSGDVHVVIVAASSAAPYVRDNKMRPLALLDTKRVSSLPQVPTSAEAGLPELTVVNWYALLAPAGTPRAVIDRLNRESVKIMAEADTREKLAGMGGESTSATPEQAAEFLRTEYDRWGKVIREAGIKVDW